MTQSTPAALVEPFFILPPITTDVAEWPPPSSPPPDCNSGLILKPAVTKRVLHKPAVVAVSEEKKTTVHC